MLERKNTITHSKKTLICLSIWNHSIHLTQIRESFGEINKKNNWNLLHACFCSSLHSRKLPTSQQIIKRFARKFCSWKKKHFFKFKFDNKYTKAFRAKWLFCITTLDCTICQRDSRANDNPKIPCKIAFYAKSIAFNLMTFSISSKGTLFGCMHCSCTSRWPSSIFHQRIERRSCICGKFKWTHRQSMSTCRCFLWMHFDKNSAEFIHV